MLHALLAASGLLAVVLSAAWVREFRLRRGLQVLLARFFHERGPQHDFPSSQVLSGPLQSVRSGTAGFARRSCPNQTAEDIDPHDGYGIGRRSTGHRRMW